MDKWKELKKFINYVHRKRCVSVNGRKIPLDSSTNMCTSIKQRMMELDAAEIVEADANESCLKYASLNSLIDSARNGSDARAKLNRVIRVTEDCIIADMISKKNFEEEASAVVENVKAVKELCTTLDERHEKTNELFDVIEKGMASLGKRLGNIEKRLERRGKVPPIKLEKIRYVSCEEDDESN